MTIVQGQVALPRLRLRLGVVPPHVNTGGTSSDCSEFAFYSEPKLSSFDLKRQCFLLSIEGLRLKRNIFFEKMQVYTIDRMPFTIKMEYS
jgi:hypothetical protein